MSNEGTRRCLCAMTALLSVRVWVMFVQRALESFGPSPIQSYYAAELFVIAAVAVFLLGSTRERAAVIRLPLPLGILSCLVGLGCAVSVEFPSLIAAVLLGAAAGAVLVWCYMSCASFCALLGERAALAAVMGAFSLSAPIIFALSLAPLPVACVVVSPLPGLSLRLCGREGAGEAPRQWAPSAEGAAKGLVPILLYLGAFFVYGLVLGNWRLSVSVEAQSFLAASVAALVNAVLPLVLLALLARLHSRGYETLAFLCQAGLVLVLTSLVLIGDGHGIVPSLWVAVIVDAVRKILSALVFATLVVALRRLPWHPFVVFGVGWAVYPLSTLLAQGLAEVLRAQRIDPASFMIYVMYGLVAVSTTLVGAAGRRSRKESANEAASPTSEVALGEGAERLCREAALTPRELEIVALVYRGWTRPYIAEKLVLSENTVRTYAKQAYRKLDVHSRAELIEKLSNPTSESTTPLSGEEKRP